jgi:MFS family permease
MGLLGPGYRGCFHHRHDAAVHAGDLCARIAGEEGEKLRRQTGNALLRSKLDAGLSPKDYVRRGIVRPLRLLVFSPIVLIFALYMAVIYSYLYLLFTSMTEVFEEFYGFSTGTVGLSFLGIGVGCLLGLGIFSSLSDRYVKKRAAESEGGEIKPEYRLQLLPYGAIIMPAGFFIYGWTAEKHVHWIVPIIGTMLIGIGNLLSFMAISLYLIDAFSIYAASALAANTVVRSSAGAVLPLAGLQMYARLGLGTFSPRPLMTALCSFANPARLP